MRTTSLSGNFSLASPDSTKAPGTWILGATLISGIPDFPELKILSPSNMIPLIQLLGAFGALVFACRIVKDLKDN